MKIVAIVSGGMDSVTLAHQLAAENEVMLLSVAYGQRHEKELAYAVKAGTRLRAPWRLVQVNHAGGLVGSALTDPTVPVPEGHYAEETMKATIVPNRNMVLLSLAIAFAVAEKADAVATGVHAGDHPVYPDCRPEFIDALQATARIANEGMISPDFEILAPFSSMTKANIATMGDWLGVPWAETWSCYKGGEIHCGRCSTCVERREAFWIAKLEDPTEYEDPAFWRTVV